MMPNEVLGRLEAIWESDKRVLKVILFGSRARGDHAPNSDIDLAIEGEGLTPGFKTILRDAAGLYTLDVVYMQELDNEELALAIEREGVVLYQKNPEKH